MIRSVLSNFMTKTLRSASILQNVCSVRRPSFQVSTQARQLSITRAMKALSLNTEYVPFGSKQRPGTAADWADDRFLHRLHLAGPKMPRVRRHPLDRKPQMKGVVLKTLIRKPKKPNSANRKCVLVRLTNGKEATAFVPGEGHNLQEHSVVLVQKKRVRDVPGLKLRVIRGAHDCAHVVKQSKKA